MDSVHFNFFNTVILTELNVNNKINFKNKDFCIVIAHLYAYQLLQIFIIKHYELHYNLA